tara:strand:- start:130 stop:321 length:192 start_codon:yes stop_codon:yes gene_type:complete
MKFNYFLMGVKLMSINKGSPPTGPTGLNLQNKKNLKFININLWSVKYGCPRGSPQMGYTKLAA